jgi:hypothetical protein
MPRVWGGWTSGYSNNFRVGFDFTVSGTTVTIERFLGESEYNIGPDTVTVIRTGRGSGSYTRTWDNPGGVEDLGGGFSFSGTRGSEYEVGVRVEGIYNSAVPSMSYDDISIPAIPPGQVAKPTVSNIKSNGARIAWTAPTSNGATIDNYQISYDDDSSGIGDTTTTGGERSHTSTARDANTGYYVKVRAHNSAGWSDDWSPAAYFKTLPLSPNAPGVPNITRVSDARHDLSWTRNATPGRPYDAQIVQRRVWVAGTWGSWTTVATLNTDYTNTGTNTWSDTSTAANRVYQYRVGGKNSTATTYSAGSEQAYTTPAAPTSATASKLSTGNIRIDFVEGTPLNASDHEIQHSTNGGTSWAVLATVASTINTYTHTSPNPALPHTYRVRTIVDAPGEPGDNLASAFRTTGTVQLEAAPLAPTGLAPNGSVEDATDAILLQWQHNPVDTTPQRKYRIGWRLQGAGTWTYLTDVDSTVSEHLLPADTWANGNIYEWIVLTWGNHANASPASAVAVVPTSARPTVSVSSPIDPYDLSLLTVAWEYFDEEATPQSEYEIKLYVDETDSLLETIGASTADASATFETRVENEQIYRIEIRVRDGDGAWSETESVVFTIEYALPPTPALVLEPDFATGSISVGVENPEPAGDEIAAVYSRVWRAINDGPWLLIADDVPLNSSIVDQIPAIGLTDRNYYRVVAVSDLPSESTAIVDDLSFGYDQGWMFLNAGPGFTQIIRVRSDLEISTSFGRQRSLNQYLGRRLPVETVGDVRSREISVSARIRPANAIASTVQEIENLTDIGGPMCYRDPLGHRYFVSAAEVAGKFKSHNESVSFNVQEIDYQE